MMQENVSTIRRRALVWLPLLFLLMLLLLPKTQAVLIGLPTEQTLPSSPDFLVSILPNHNVTTTATKPFVYLGTVPGPTGRGLMNVSFVKLTLPPKQSLLSVQVTVQQNATVPIQQASLRPRHSPHVTINNNNTLHFNLTGAGHYLLEINGEWNVQTLSKGLMLFVSEEEPPPDPNDPSVVYFPAGVHTLPGGVLQLQNDSTVYLAPDALVLGRLEATNVHHVTISGTGILASEWLPGWAVPPSQLKCHHCGCPGTSAILLQNSSRVDITGSLTLLHASGWMVKLDQVTEAHVKGLQLLGWRCNNDGIDVVSSRRVRIEQSFIRSADDAIAIKGMAPTKDTTDILVQDSLLFPHGNCMEIGFELLNDHVHNISFQRSICMHQMMNAMSIHNGGHSKVSQITYRDIVIEGVSGSRVSHDDSYGLKLLDLQISQGKYSHQDEARRGSIGDVLYSNVHYNTNGLDWLRSRIVGNSSEHAIQGVRFRNFTINGRVVSSLQDIQAISNAFVGNVTFDSLAQPFLPAQTTVEEEDPWDTTRLE